MAFMTCDMCGESGTDYRIIVSPESNPGEQEMTRRFCAFCADIVVGMVADETVYGD